MGLYGDHVLPRLIAFGMRGEGFAEQRAHALDGVRGRVLELGFGAGHNVPHYGDEVTELLALEPAQVNRKLANVHECMLVRRTHVQSIQLDHRIQHEGECRLHRRRTGRTTEPARRAIP